jgi:hypothetical protein
MLVEAKWRSGIGASQGVDGNKDQIRLRVEFCEKYGAQLYPSVTQFVVLLVSRERGGLTKEQAALSSGRVRVVETTWHEAGRLPSNPLRDEFIEQLAWRQSRSQAG